MDSFRNRILTAVLALLVLVQAATTVAVLERAGAELQSLTATNLRTRVGALRQRLATRFEVARTHLTGLAAQPLFQARLAAADVPALDALMRADSGVGAAQLDFLIDSRGALLACSGVDCSDAVRAELDVVASTALAHHGEGALDVLAVLDGRPYRIVLVRLPGDRPGWFGGGYLLDQRAIEALGSRSDVDVTLLARDPNGTHFSATTLPRALKPWLGVLEQTPLAAEATQTLPMGDAPYLTTLLPMAPLRGEIRLIVQLSLADTQARLAHLREQVLAISGAALVGAALLLLLLTRRALRPIDELVRAAQRIERGDYGERLTVGGGREFARLAAVFDSMQQRIAERESRIVHQARHDVLTGLPNRVAAHSRLKRLLRGAAPVGVVLVDLRDFKHLNASFGHELGDQVLQEVARRLAAALRSGDYLARLGTDQFLLLLPGNGTEQSQATAGQVVRGIRQNLLLGSIEVHLDASAGVCSSPADGTEAEELLRRADLALQEAKRSGEPTCSYQSEHDDRHRKRLRLLTDLHGAIASDQLHLVYQPKVLMSDRRVRSLEALVRWNHPQLGPVPPGEFVPLAEQTGSMAQLTRWVLRSAIAQLGHWRREGFASEIAVNVSASDVVDARLPDEILALLKQHQVRPEQLLLEITESAVMQDLEQAIRGMRRLRAAGVRFAIDDFGTGHSSLAQLKALPVDELKIDRTFVRDLQPGTRDDAIVRSAVELAHVLGLKVVAEGIETAAAWTALLRLGCDYAQGYFISPPIAPEHVGEWIQEINTRLSAAESGTAQIRVLTELRTNRRP
ncbi:MAG TPA: GGDEF domain-containing protein [Steroidobacteraceae bacterium]|nr:GGDEF domain-containing protein [Steroidobacteraceae bacterium]